MSNQRFIDDLNRSLITKKDYEFHKNNPFIRPLFKMNENVKYIDVDVNYHPKGYTFKEMKEIILLAFLSIDERLYERILLMLENPKYKHNVFYKKSDRRYGDNSCGSSKKRVEVNITFDNTARGLLTLAHEYIHAIGGRNVKRTKPREDCIGEIESLFIEKVLEDYFLKDGIISEDEYKLLHIERNNSFKNDLIFVLKNEKIMSLIQIPLTKEKLKELKDELLQSEEGWNIFKGIYEYPKEEHTSSYRVRYIVGEIVASLLYEEYKLDKKHTMNKFIEFLDNNEKYSLDETTRLLVGKNPFEVLENIINKTK